MKTTVCFTLFIAAITFIITSCSAPKNSVTGAPSVARGKFTGVWTITNINYEGLVERAVQNVFDQATPAAFRNSTWNLTNSGNGIYTLSNGTSQTIYWSVNNSDAKGQLFQFKKIYQGDKPKNVAEGYQLYVQNNDGSQMILKSPVNVGSGVGFVVYTFSKKYEPHLNPLQRRGL